MKENLKNLNAASVRAMLCVGGYTGWYLTVMYICRKSLDLYGTSSLFAGMEIMFGGALLAVLAVMLLMMFHLDFEGLLAHRYFRAVPAVLMAESGVALAFTNADSFGVYAIITGICAAFGVLAVFSSLLNVRVSLRLFSVAVGAALGGLVRVADRFLYGMTDMTRGIYLLAALSGILALLTVRSSGFSKEAMPIISYSEAPAKSLLRNIPSAYALLFLLGCAYYYCLGRMGALGDALAPPIFHAHDLFSYAPFVLTGLFIGFLLQFHHVTPIYAFGACFMSFSAILLWLPYFSDTENAVFLACQYIGQACFGIFAYLFILTFAMDRRHPLFHAVFGFVCLTAAQLAVNLMLYHSPAGGRGAVLAVLAAAIVPGAPIIYSLLKKYGLTQESFELRGALREAIAAKSAAMALSDREKYLLELVVLDGYTTEQLPDKMMLSRNTVRAQTRNLLKKLDVEEASQLRGYFEAEVNASAK